jgi:uncharacterized protein
MVMWLQTYSGVAFDPEFPAPEKIFIVDIAHALSMQCRYAGHCLRFMSVAEHCCLVSDEAPTEHKLSALMHDASEAYLVDIPRPIKHLLEGYSKLEDRLMGVIADKFKFDWPLPKIVKHLDNAILTDERKHNMKSMDVSAADWGAPYPPLGVRLEFWSPSEAKEQFLWRFHEYETIKS